MIMQKYNVEIGLREGLRFKLIMCQNTYEQVCVMCSKHITGTEASASAISRLQDASAVNCRGN